MLVLPLAVLAACARQGDPNAEAKALIAANCATCHVVPGVRSARGLVGPPLIGFAGRQAIAGVLANTPPNLRTFLLHPRAIVPHGAMPELGLSAQQADVIANYLDRQDRT